MSSFEKAIKKLEECNNALQSGKLSLEESIKVYEESVKFYNECNEILKEAKQKIEVYRPEKDLTEDFEN